MTDSLKLTGTLSHEECCTILAALRLFQSVQEVQQEGYPRGNRHQGLCVIHPNNRVSLTFADVRELEHFEDDTTPLTGEQIDDLCERINLAPAGQR